MQACPRCRATYPDDVSTCPEDGAALLPSGMLAPVDAPLEPGTMVGEYRVDKKLGAGTFGDVYSGEQPVIGKRVAIKLLHRKLSSDAEVVSRFVAEARAVNRIRHRHIIDIFSFGMLGDHRHYFVMELLDGLTLGELLERERRLSLDVALPIFRGIASALDAAHEAGITHRDLKPDNVFLAVEKDGSYFPKLLDFGIAKLAGEDVAHRTATGMAMGTPRYMSPEQCRGKKVDHKADIYSLGAVIHEVLTGKPLFDGDGTMDIFFKHTSEMPAPMSQVCPDLPPELDAPVLAMLAKKPKDRPESAGAAVRDLIERARAAGQAATLPVSSQSVRHVVRPVTEDPTAPRLPPDAATVAVRQRAPIQTDDASTPDATGPAVSGSSSKDVPTVEMSGAAAVSVDVSSLEDGGVAHRSTEIAPASRVSGTLLSSGPQPEAVASQPGPTMRSPAIAEGEEVAAKRSPAPDRPRPIPWVAIVVAAVVLVAGSLAIQRALGPSSSGAAADGSGVSASSAPASPPASSSASSTSPTASASSASPGTTSSGMEASAPGVEDAASTAAQAASAPTSAKGSARPPAAASAVGKPIASPAPHSDLETPPELDPKTPKKR